MLSKLLLSLSLAVAPAVSVSAQSVYEDFDTFQTADKYLEDFNYVNEYSYRLSVGSFGDIDYSGEPYRFYAFPIYYDIFSYFTIYYSNADYNFFTHLERPYEFKVTSWLINNYNGSETEFDFLALDYVGMSQVIEHDKAEKSNSISIYNSFYNFFTGFFPNEVVAEYHGIFTFVIVAFLLFLVFGFVFFLFRVIRRLVGFK